MQKSLVRNLFLVLLLSTAESWALPPCPGSYDNNTWTNCQGTATYADGGKYVGEYKDDKRHGQGTATLAHGRKYVGEFKTGEKHGAGTVTWANGGKYVGEWKDGNRYGQGTFTWAFGGAGKPPFGPMGVQEDIWKEGESGPSLKSVMDNQMGNKYRDGDGLYQDYKEALNLYFLSAERGNKDAMLNIARLYQAGKVTDTLSLTVRIFDWWDGTNSGRIAAYMWASLAGGDLRDEIAESLTASELEKAQALSTTCLKKKYKQC